MIKNYFLSPILALCISLTGYAQTQIGQGCGMNLSVSPASSGIVNVEICVIVDITLRLSEECCSVCDQRWRWPSQQSLQHIASGNHARGTTDAHSRSYSLAVSWHQ